MYKIYAHSNTQELHTIFKAKLERYGFKAIGNKTWVGPETVDDLTAVFFYKNNLCSNQSPLSVTAKRTERVV